MYTEPSQKVTVEDHDTVYGDEFSGDAILNYFV